MNSFQSTMRRYLAEDHEDKACIIGHSFVRRIVNRWQRDDLPLPNFSFDAFGTGGLKLPTLLKIVSSADLSGYKAVFIQAGENDIMDRTMANNKRLLLQIYDEVKAQGVEEVAFGELFPRHDYFYNKRVSLLNRVLLKTHPEKLWLHGPELATTSAIRSSDGTHLTVEREIAFSESIEDAIITMRRR